MTEKIDRRDFQKNRYDVVTRCIERGINYVDACCREEILAYAKALKGRRDKMYFGYSWHIWESRFKEWRPRKKLREGLDQGMKEAGLDYVDLWRISLLVDSSQHSKADVEEAVAALDWAKKTGRARFIGVSSHDRDPSCPYQLPHAPVGAAEVLSRFLERIQTLAQGIVDPVGIRRALSIDGFLVHVTILPP